jgi:hypothetical protein
MHRKKLGEPKSLPAEGMVWMVVKAGQILLSIMRACLHISQTLNCSITTRAEEYAMEDKSSGQM